MGKQSLLLNVLHRVQVLDFATSEPSVAQDDTERKVGCYKMFSTLALNILRRLRPDRGEHHAL